MNGSPSTRQFINRILKEVSAPILTMIKTWMIEGEINDPFREFHVEIYGVKKVVDYRKEFDT